MSNLDNISEPSVPQADRKAKQEEDNFIVEAKRKNRMDAAINWAGIFFIWTFMLVVLSIIGVRVFHNACKSGISMAE